MTERATGWHDDTRRPVTEKAEQAIDLFRRTFGVDPIYLRTGLHDARLLAAAGWSEVSVTADPHVQRHCMYAIGEKP